ncbi:MAG TPA: hypothetical protein ENJ89_11330 [Caldithrix abyssi]|uniref:Glycine zipper family protein n=1 Tax=Caldithrix abyssi TaxID=187145 RepID=A0A7V5PR87_CALAY|nr:hypothetical protein [Caldithrix abyssi]
MKKMILILLVLLASTVALRAQVHSWEIGYTGRQIYPNVILEKLAEDTLYVQAYGDTHAIPIDSIRYVKSLEQKSSYAGVGLVVGVILGGTAGYIVGRTANTASPLYKSEEDITSFYGTVIGMVGGGVLGYGVGHGLGLGAYYNLKKRDHEQRKTLLRLLIAQSQDRLKR